VDGGGGVGHQPDVPKRNKFAFREFVLESDTPPPPPSTDVRPDRNIFCVSDVSFLDGGEGGVSSEWTFLDRVGRPKSLFLLGRF